MRITSIGGGGPGSRLATFTDESPWLGDYVSPGIRAVTVDLMNPTTSPSLEMRLVLFAAVPDSSRWTSSVPAIVPNDGIWRSYRFFAAESALTRVSGVGTYAHLIGNVARVMLRHDAGTPSAGGTAVVASLGIDNPRLVPDINCQVFNQLTAAIAAGLNDPAWDLNRDGLVNQADLSLLRSLGGLVNLPSGNPYLPGDANLDGTVDQQDFAIWQAHKFSAMGEWCSGDFNADGVVDGSDFGIWNEHKGMSSAEIVPEPGPTWILWIAMTLGGRMAGRRKRGLWQGHNWAA